MIWTLVGHGSGEILTLDGVAWLHPNRAEAEFLTAGTVRVVGLPVSGPEEFASRYGRPARWLKEHPDMSAVEFPIDKRRFRS